MTEYERTLSVEAPADAIFEYVSDVANVQRHLPVVEGAQFSRDAEKRFVKWSSDGQSGAIKIDAGDVTSEISEITIHLRFEHRKVADIPTKFDEDTLATIDKALKDIREHVEHAHRSRRANFM